MEDWKYKQFPVLQLSPIMEPSKNQSEIYLSSKDSPQNSNSAPVAAQRDINRTAYHLKPTRLYQATRHGSWKSPYWSAAEPGRSEFQPLRSPRGAPGGRQGTSRSTVCHTWLSGRASPTPFTTRRAQPESCSSFPRRIRLARSKPRALESAPEPHSHTEASSPARPARREA
jgi:hypothetical protein